MMGGMIKNLLTILVLLEFYLGALNVDCALCDKKICAYEFVIRESRSMMYAVNYPTGWQDVYDVVLNGSKLDLKPTRFHGETPRIEHDELLEKAHTLDGVAAPIIVINDQFPGPTIEVMEGAQIVVRVKNDLFKETTTIHWHGMHQKSSFYSDGVPFVTQCPILPKQTFVYRFFANPAGTHWYHSHVVNQKKDGVYGAVVIHRKPPVLSSHVLVLSDWFHVSATELEVSNPYKTFDRGSGMFHYKTIDRGHSFDGVKLSAIAFTSGLINGRGRYGHNKAPLSTFDVVKNKKHRLHIVASMAEYAYRLSVDNHTMTVVESDGYPVEPEEVQSLIVFGGETYVVEIEAKQTVYSYWIRAETLRDGVGPFVEDDGKPKGSALAILRYKDSHASLEDPGPLSVPVECNKNSPCRVLNCPWREFPADRYAHTYCVHVEKLRMSSSVLGQVDQSILKDDGEDVHEIFLNFAFSFGSSVNNHRFIAPRSAPLYEKGKTQLLPCSEDCFDKGCRCTNVIKIPPNKTIQIVFMGFTTVNDFGKNYSNKAHHPVHLHGHSFFVLKQSFGETDNMTKRIIGLNEDIACENKPCSRQKWKNGKNLDLNLVNPPVKDTVIVPAQGYTVVRFRSDNPGFWFLHCHTMFHLVEGMVLVLDESSETIKKPPKGFPKCSSFEWSDDDFSNWVSAKDTQENGDEITSCSNHIQIALLAGVVVVSVLLIFIIVWFVFVHKKMQNREVMFGYHCQIRTHKSCLFD